MKTIFTFLFALISICIASAQTPDPVILRMEVEQVSGSNNHVITKLFVSNFKNILGYQFSSRWIPGEMFFMDFERFGPIEMGMNEANFGLTQVLFGSIRTSWTYAPAGGLTLDDETELFALRFKKIWGDGKFSVEGHPIVIEFIDNNFNLLDLIFIDNLGGVSYYKNGILSAIHNLESDKIALFPVPAKDKVFFKWDQLKQVPDQAFIYNLNGQLLGQQTIADQSIALPESLVSGTYLVMFQKAGETLAVKKLQVQK